MMVGRFNILLVNLMVFVSCSACNETSPTISEVTESNEDVSEGNVELLYMGQASVRIITETGKGIYVDPFSGEGYSLPADLILVIHEHFDHNAVDKVANRNIGCRLIRSRDAIKDGEYNLFKLDYVLVEPVNDWYNFNDEYTEQFNVRGKLIIKPGESIIMD